MDNVIEALGKGRKKKGKGLKEDFKEKFEKVKKFVKKHKEKIAGVAGALGTIGTIGALASLASKKQPKKYERLNLEQYEPYGLKNPLLYPPYVAQPESKQERHEPALLNPFLEAVQSSRRNSKSGGGVKEVKDFLKKHKGKIAAATAALGAIGAIAALAYNKRPKKNLLLYQPPYIGQPAPIQPYIGQPESKQPYIAQPAQIPPPQTPPIQSRRQSSSLLGLAPITPSERISRSSSSSRFTDLPPLEDIPGIRLENKPKSKLENLIERLNRDPKLPQKLSQENPVLYQKILELQRRAQSSSEVDMPPPVRPQIRRQSAVPPLSQFKRSQAVLNLPSPMSLELPPDIPPKRPNRRSQVPQGIYIPKPPPPPLSEKKGDGKKKKQNNSILKQVMNYKIKNKVSLIEAWKAIRGY
jgi:hypothetical protein